MRKTARTTLLFVVMQWLLVIGAFFRRCALRTVNELFNHANVKILDSFTTMHFPNGESLGLTDRENSC